MSVRSNWKTGPLKTAKLICLKILQRFYIENESYFYSSSQSRQAKTHTKKQHAILKIRARRIGISVENLKQCLVWYNLTYYEKSNSKGASIVAGILRNYKYSLRRANTSHDCINLTINKQGSYRKPHDRDYVSLLSRLMFHFETFFNILGRFLIHTSKRNKTAVKNSLNTSYRFYE